MPLQFFYWDMNSRFELPWPSGSIMHHTDTFNITNANFSDIQKIIFKPSFIIWDNHSYTEIHAPTCILTYYTHKHILTHSFTYSLLLTNISEPIFLITCIYTLQHIAKLLLHNTYAVIYSYVPAYTFLLRTYNFTHT